MSLHRMPALVAALVIAIAASPAIAQVSVSDAWVRGTVPGQKTTGAFMRLTSTADLTLVAATSPVAKIVELHEMKVEGGMMRMAAVARLPLPAGKTVELKPGGYHMMLMGLAHPLKDGDRVPITMTFEDKTGTKQSIDLMASVRGLGK